MLVYVNFYLRRINDWTSLLCPCSTWKAIQIVMVNYNHISYCSFDVEDTVKPECVKGPLSKRPKVVFQLSLNARQKCCRMLTLEHSVILLTFIKLPFVIKIFVLSILSDRFTQVLLYSRYFILISMSCTIPWTCLTFDRSKVERSSSDKAYIFPSWHDYMYNHLIFKSP